MRDYTLAIRLRSSDPRALDLLMSPTTLKACHPMIVDIRVLESTLQRLSMAVTDRLEGCCGMTFEDQALLQRTGPRTIRGRAWQFPRITLDSEYSLSSQGVLTQSTRVEAPCCLQGLTSRMAEDAHRAYLDNFRELADRQLKEYERL